MRYRISAPKNINTTINLPASKSISNRALIINALANDNKNECKNLENLSDCDDTEVLIAAFRDKPDVVDIKAAGTAMRFLTAYLATVPGTRVITGTQRMKNRPIRVLVDALRYLDAKIEYVEKEGFPPLKITGNEMEGGYLEVSGDISSQFISALLMIGPTLKKGLKLRLMGEIMSRPYIDLTLCTMRDFGAEAEWTDIDIIEVTPKPYKSREYYVESDWSAASYWYEILALSGNEGDTIHLLGLSDGSRQGDSITRYLFSLLGVKTIFEEKKSGKPQVVTLRKTQRRPNRLEYDFKNAPDLAQTFVVTCVMMNTHFRFTGLATLKVKETDRIEALKNELMKFGYVIRSYNDNELVWDGERCEAEETPVVETYEDHRMALSFAPIAMTMDNVVINNPQVVTKSYPDFWRDMRSAGFYIEEV